MLLSLPNKRLPVKIDYPFSSLLNYWIGMNPQMTMIHWGKASNAEMGIIHIPELFVSQELRLL